MEKRPLRYHSFILTLWQETEAASGSHPVWRFRLEDPHTSERRGFTDMADLLRFLSQWAEMLPPEERPSDDC
jgi:hypothetical protein